MQADQYREMLTAVDTALVTMQKALGDFTIEDHHLAYQLDIVRTNLLKAHASCTRPIRNWVTSPPSLN